MIRANFLLLAYCACWTIAFGITTSAQSVRKRRFKDADLPPWLSGTQGDRMALFAGFIAIICTGSICVWAVSYLRWYSALAGWFCGLLASTIVFQRSITRPALIVFGPPLLLFVNACLWLLR